jgi:hypothetical protein
MKTFTIEEGNVFIADFMGVLNPETNLSTIKEFGEYKLMWGEYEYIDVFKIQDLRYHAEWKWLMPVIQKISNIVGFKTMDECTKEEWVAYEILTLRLTTEINNAWTYVIKFILWYNKQKK